MTDLTNPNSTSLKFPNVGDARFDGACGTVQLPGANVSASNLYSWGLQTVILEFDGYVREYVQGNISPTTFPDDVFYRAYNAYTAVIEPLNLSANGANGLAADVANNAKRVGWILAGMFYYDIATLTAMRHGRLRSFQPLRPILRACATPARCSEIVCRPTAAATFATRYCRVRSEIFIQKPRITEEPTPSARQVL